MIIFKTADSIPIIVSRSSCIVFYTLVLLLWNRNISEFVFLELHVNSGYKQISFYDKNVDNVLVIVDAVVKQKVTHPPKLEVRQTATQNPLPLYGLS